MRKTKQTWEMYVCSLYAESSPNHGSCPWVAYPHVINHLYLPQQNRFNDALLILHCEDHKENSNFSDRQQENVTRRLDLGQRANVFNDNSRKDTPYLARSSRCK
uniref:Uncharacterized protein n=1 Tax=Glossina pallidipes TaxID=7398 RepID=A0A1B0A3T5_GLOPL